MFFGALWPSIKHHAHSRAVSSRLGYLPEDLRFHHQSDNFSRKSSVYYVLLTNIYFFPSNKYFTTHLIKVSIYIVMRHCGCKYCARLPIGGHVMGLKVTPEQFCKPVSVVAVLISWQIFWFTSFCNDFKPYWQPKKRSMCNSGKLTKR